jgi:hypothetical protein
MKGQKKDGTARKSTKGIPRITDKVVAMDEAGRQAWLAKVPAEHRKDVEARLVKAVAAGLKPRKVNFETIFAGRSVEELTAAKTHLDAALSLAAVSAETELEKEIAAKTAQLSALRSAKATA